MQFRPLKQQPSRQPAIMPSCTGYWYYHSDDDNRRIFIFWTTFSSPYTMPDRSGNCNNQLAFAVRSKANIIKIGTTNPPVPRRIPGHLTIPLLFWIFRNYPKLHPSSNHAPIMSHHHHLTTTIFFIRPTLFKCGYIPIWFPLKPSRVNSPLSPHLCKLKISSNPIQ